MRSEWIAGGAQAGASAFPAAGSLELVIVDIWELLPRSSTAIQHFLIITDRFFEMVGAIPEAKINFRPIATIFLNNWVMLHLMLSQVLTDIEIQFVNRIFYKNFPFPKDEEAHHNTKSHAEKRAG